VALVGFGFFPSLLTDVIEPTTTQVLEQVASALPAAEGGN
jgi:NADH:ubiquinone oxidoreductase subunit 4 (subunit M)